jgi:hypothetical protein
MYRSEKQTGATVYDILKHLKHNPPRKGFVVCIYCNENQGTMPALKTHVCSCWMIHKEESISNAERTTD